ncbi:MAG: C-terminal binding protein [SAR202 cluster bacterium]|nr:C-terminal binding protein [SAR202 cluster bacterium]
MAKFKIVSEPGGGVRMNVPGKPYEYEKDGLGGVDAEIVEAPITSAEAFLSVARDADAVYAANFRISRQVIEGLQKCKIIACGSVGTDAVDLVAATERCIPVTNDPDTFIEEVADHSMALLLSMFRRVTLTDRMARDGRWREARPYLYQFPRLWGQTLGFVAFGNVARATALRAAPFGVKMLAYDPYISELNMTRYGVEPVGLKELLQRSDIVSMHAPNTPETFHMLREEHFRMMKPTALFISTGRGSTVEEKSLINALQEGWIAGAGLDVLEVEPPAPDNPLLTMENVILTPHVASASARMEPERRRRVGREIALVLSGRRPMACVNPTVLDKLPLLKWVPQRG